MTETTLLFDVLDALATPWALLDAQGHIRQWHPAFLPDAVQDDPGPLTTWFPQVPWPPQGEGTWQVRLDPGRTLFLFPYPEAQTPYLAVLHRHGTNLATMPVPGGKTFLNMMVHELRLPLTPIRGYGELLLQGMLGDLNEQQKQVLRTMVESVARMNRLLQRLSLLGKIESGQLRVSPQPVAVARWLEEKLAEHRPALAQAGLSLVVERPETLPTLSLDVNHLSTVFDALLENARLYTPEGGTVTVTVEPATARLTLAVADTGFGIPPEEREYLFQPFFRGSADHIRRHKGWGMSLYTAYRLVRYLGGEMGYTPQTPQGSRFWFWLPAREAQG